MSDETQAQAAETAQEAQTTSDATTDATQEVAVETFDRTYVETLRKEAAANRKRLRELEAKVKEEDDKKLSEQDRMAKRVAELEQDSKLINDRYRRAVTDGAVVAAAVNAGIKPDLAVRLLATHSFEYDDDGKPKGVQAALSELKKLYPELAGVAGAAGNPQRGADKEAKETDAQKRARLSGAGFDPFDPQLAARLGGGALSSQE